MHFVVNDTDRQLNIIVTESRIDAAVATQFRDKLRAIVMKCRKPVHLDMSQVDFMDSSGLGAMIAIRKSLPENLPVILSALTPNVERVFRLTRMDSVFQITSPSTQETQGE